MTGAEEQPIPTPADVRELVDRLGRRLEQVEEAAASRSAGGLTAAEATEQARLIEQAEADMGQLSRTAERALRSADIAGREQMAWERGAHEAGRIARQLDGELDTVAAELHLHLSDDVDLGDALRAVAESWRGRVDELRVQAGLARMELRDQANQNVDRVEELVDALRRRIEEVGGRTADATHDLRRSTSELTTTARDAARETGTWLVEHAGPGDDGGDDGATS